MVFPRVQTDIMYFLESRQTYWYFLEWDGHDGISQTLDGHDGASGYYKFQLIATLASGFIEEVSVLTTSCLDRRWQLN